MYSKIILGKILLT